MTAIEETGAEPGTLVSGATDDLPDVTTLLGLRSAALAASIGVMAIGYIVALIGTSGSDTAWAAQYLALALALFTIAAAVVIPGDRLPIPTALVLAAAGLTALAVAWWYMPPDIPNWWVVVTAPPAVTAVLVGVFALRGRAVVAWLTFLGALVVAAAWSIHYSESTSLILPMTNRILGTVLPAAIIASTVRPLLELVAALRDRELADVQARAASSAVLTERSDRRESIAREAGPLLELVAEGKPLTREQALAARLLEHTLRDEVRGRGWDSEGVRQAAATARARGVTVSLFDDGGLAGRSLTADEAERLRGELIRRLTIAESGSVTARILPPGRDHLAVINTVSETSHSRRICRATPTGLRWSAEPDAGKVGRRSG